MGYHMCLVGAELGTNKDLGQINIGKWKKRGKCYPWRMMGWIENRVGNKTQLIF